MLQSFKALIYLLPSSSHRLDLKPTRARHTAVARLLSLNGQLLQMADVISLDLEGTSSDLPLDLCDDSPEFLVHSNTGSSGNTADVRQKCEVVDLTGSEDEVVLVSEAVIDNPVLVTVHSPESVRPSRCRKRSRNRPTNLKKCHFVEETVEKSQTPELKIKCAICWNTMFELTCTPCGHIYCVRCIERELQDRKRCPQCRRACTKRQLRRLFV